MSVTSDTKSDNILYLYQISEPQDIEQRLSGRMTEREKEVMARYVFEKLRLPPAMLAEDVEAEMREAKVKKYFEFTLGVLALLAIVGKALDFSADVMTVIIVGLLCLIAAAAGKSIGAKLERNGREVRGKVLQGGLSIARGCYVDFSTYTVVYAKLNETIPLEQFGLFWLFDLARQEGMSL